MRTTGKLILLVVVVSLTACSYSTDFVIVNDTTEILNIEYRVKEFPGEFSPPATPSILPVSQLSSRGNRQWTRLQSEQYNVDPQKRTVSVRIGPGQALLEVETARAFGAPNARLFPDSRSLSALSSFRSEFLSSAGLMSDSRAVVWLVHSAPGKSDRSGSTAVLTGSRALR